MIKYENECVGCSTGSYPCRPDHCKYSKVPHFYCDECGEEFDYLYEYEFEQLCIDCIKQRLTKIM